MSKIYVVKRVETYEVEAENSDHAIEILRDCGSSYPSVKLIKVEVTR